MKKIMFNDRFLLTQAVLDGRKTQIRRLVPNEVFTLQWDFRGAPDNLEILVETPDGDFVDIRHTKFAQYKVDETVAVAQSYYDAKVVGDTTVGWARVFDDGDAGYTNKRFVKASLMPHQIRITNVRVQRLQDISDEDCIKEGIEEIGMIDDPGYIYPNDPVYQTDGYDTPQEAYASLIDRINGKGTWDSNPYVFAYDFDLIK